MRAQILAARFRNECEEREVDPALGIALLGLAAQLRHAREVHFEKTRHVRRHALRHHHVIGGDLADLGPGLDPVARPRLDGGMLYCPRAQGLGPLAWGWNGWRAFDVAEDVLLRHPAGVPAARNP